MRVDLTGRLLLADRREYPCQVQDISSGSAALIAPVASKIGERVIVYLECIGRLEGTITRVFSNGFAMRIAGTAHKRDKLAGQLTWLANRQMFSGPDQQLAGESRRILLRASRRTSKAL